MKIVETKVYQYKELNENAKEKAREWYLKGFDFDFEWDCIKDDAKTIGLNLTEWDRGRSSDGELTVSIEECIKRIMAEHGPKCETYKTAKEYKKKLSNVKDDEEKESLGEEFLKSLLEDYRIMADEQYDFCQSEEAIAETMEANEYEFTEDGRRF